MKALLEGATQYAFAQILLNGQDGVWGKEDVRDLESLILEKCSNDDARRFLRVLRAAALRWSAETRTRVELPRIPLPPYPYHNPFREGVKIRLQQYEESKELLVRWLNGLQNRVGTNGDPDSAHLLNALLLSAVVHGGLLDQTLLVAVLRAIPEKESRTLIVDGRLHIELLLGWKGIADSELRRWQPDPLSAMLWTKIPANAAESLLELPSVAGKEALRRSEKEVLRAFSKQFHMALQAAELRYCKGLKDILRASYMVAHTQIPPIVVRYASREIISHSLTRAALERSTNCKGISPNRLGNTGDDAKEPAGNAGEKISKSRARLREYPDWLGSTIDALESKSPEASLAQIGSGSVDRLIRTFADFAHWLLSVTGRSGSGYDVQTALEIVSVVGQYLGPFLEGTDPAGLDDETITDLYFQAMEKARMFACERHLASRSTPAASKTEHRFTRKESGGPTRSVLSSNSVCLSAMCSSTAGIFFTTSFLRRPRFRNHNGYW